MIQRHLTFKVTAEHADAFERYFEKSYRPAMTQAPGYIRAELLREVDDPTHYRMMLGWADADAATGWRTSPVHQGLQPELNALHEGMEGTSYDVIA